MAGWWAPAELYGLWVDCGDWHHRNRRWLRLPWARFTCQHGCVDEAFGPADVAHFTEHIDEDHARTCPGLEKGLRDDEAAEQTDTDPG